MCDLVERHIWALGKGLDQWQGPPDDDEEEEEQKEEEKEEEEKPTQVFAPLSPRSQKCFSDQQNVSIESQKEMFH